MTNKTILSTLLLLILSLNTQIAHADGPQWPVRNPLIKKKGFVADFRSRIVSGIYGARLKWGANRYDHHEGWDFYAFYDKKTYPKGHHPVHCAADGKVFKVINPASPNSVETGRKIVIKHDLSWGKLGSPKKWGPVFTGYNHMHSIGVKEGQAVKAGDVVGLAGKTGYTKTVHLHFNCYRYDGTRLVNVNPSRLYQKKKGWITKLTKKNVSVRTVHLDRSQNMATVRLFTPNSALTFDGFELKFGSDKVWGFSFEAVSAKARDRRDRGDKDLFKNLKIFPLRFNGGESADELNKSNRLPSPWPARSLPVKAKGAYIGWDIVLLNIPPSAKKYTITIRGVYGEKIKLKRTLESKPEGKTQ